jgi:hypothetical protein
MARQRNLIYLSLGLGLMQPVQVVIEASLRSAVLPSMTEELKLQINDGEADCLRGGLATVFNAVMTNPPLGRNSPRL